MVLIVRFIIGTSQGLHNPLYRSNPYEYFPICWYFAKPIWLMPCQDMSDASKNLFEYGMPMRHSQMSAYGNLCLFSCVKVQLIY